MGMDTILWPSDLSKASLMAAEQVMSLAEKYTARVVVLYVGVDLCSYFPAYGNYPSQKILQDFQSWEMGEARKKLDSLCNELLHGCPNLKVRLVQGDAATEIIKAAVDEKAGMIVMTSRGASLDRSPEETTGLGSVARKVLETSTIPVQIVYP